MEQNVIFVGIMAIIMMAIFLIVLITRQSTGRNIFVRDNPDVYIVGTTYWPASSWNWFGGYGGIAHRRTGHLPDRRWQTKATPKTYYK